MALLPLAAFHGPGGAHGHVAGEDIAVAGAERQRDELAQSFADSFTRLAVAGIQREPVPDARLIEPVAVTHGVLSLVWLTMPGDGLAVRAGVGNSLPGAQRG